MPLACQVWNRFLSRFPKCPLGNDDGKVTLDDTARWSLSVAQQACQAMAIVGGDGSLAFSLDIV